MKQDGYHERTKYNRVRCLRKNNEPFVNATFNRWQATENSSVTNENSNYILVGQNIEYYVTISADSAPTSVKIGGVGATQKGTTSRTGTSNTVWYVEKSWSSKGVYQMDIEVTTVDGKDYTFKNVGSVTVYRYTVSNTQATSLKKDGKTMYVMQNTSYPSTWLTTSGTNVAASDSKDEYRFVTIEDGNKIKSVKKGTYFYGTNSNVSLNSSGTNYTISLQNGQSYYITYSNRFLQQTDNTTVSISKTTTNRNWYFYEVTYDMP
jgi:hypothetical protein